MAEHTRKEELTTELSAARQRMSGYVTALRHDLDLGTRLKSSVAQNQIVWFAGAAVIGLLLAKIPAGRRKVVVKGPKLRSNDQVEKAGKAAFILTAVKFAFDFVKPMLMTLAKERLLGTRAATAAAHRRAN